VSIATFEGIAMVIGMDGWWGRKWLLWIPGGRGTSIRPKTRYRN